MSVLSRVPSTKNCTRAMPRSSLALTRHVVSALMVALLLGAAKLIVGGALLVLPFLIVMLRDELA